MINFDEYDCSRGVLQDLIDYMQSRHIEITRANLAHAVEAEQIKDLLDDAGVEFADDGRRDQVSPTKDGAGMVRLSFAQVYQMLGLRRPAEPGIRPLAGDVR